MITEAYRIQNRLMHAEDDTYGRMGKLYVDHVNYVANQIGAASILDYGCGKSTLRQAMPGWPDFREYDPAVAGKEGLPDKADLVVCTDVMEHIEPQFCDEVLDHIQALAMRGVFFVIAIKPAIKPLPDGTNPHKILESEIWWLNKLCKRWHLWQFENNPKRFAVFMKVW